MLFVCDLLLLPMGLHFYVFLRYITARYLTNTVYFFLYSHLCHKTFTTRLSSNTRLYRNHIQGNHKPDIEIVIHVAVIARSEKCFR